MLASRQLTQKNAGRGGMALPLWASVFLPVREAALGNPPPPHFWRAVSVTRRYLKCGTFTTAQLRTLTKQTEAFRHH